MNIVISGGSNTAEYLIRTMLEHGHNVSVIDEDHDVVDHLSEVLPTCVNLVEGDGTDPQVQRDAFVGDADLFMALMGHDDVNLVACEIAKHAFGIPRCIASVNSPKNERIFRKVGIEPVSATELIARMVEQEEIVGDMRMVFSLREGDIIMVETTIPAHIRHREGIRVADIAISNNVQIIAVVRDDDFIMVSGDTVLMPDETIIAAMKSDAEDDFKALLASL